MRSALAPAAVLLALCLPFADAPATVSRLPGTSGPDVVLRDAPARLPLFVANRGQTDPRVDLYFPGRELSVFFGPGGLTWAIGQACGRWVVKVDFVGAAPVHAEGRDPAPTAYNFFRGPESEWITGVPAFRAVVYRDLWPGIDLLCTIGAEGIKSEWHVRPGADPGLIRLGVRGATFVGVDGAGALEVETPWGTVVEDAPVAFQPGGGAVAAAWRTSPAGCGFALGEYDSALPLVIDPVVFVYSGCIGGGQTDRALGVAVDSLGYAYITGSSYGGAPVFPATAGPDLTNNGQDDAFVAKISPDGATVVYAGFLGGALNDEGSGIAIDADGCVYVAGQTFSSDFPVAVGPDLTLNAAGETGAADAFVAKVSADGTSLVFCGYIGGAGGDTAGGVAIDSARNVYVAGETSSTEATFPETVGPDLTWNMGRDGFVAKVKADGTALLYAGYIGGDSDDMLEAIAVDAATGEAFVAGQTLSSDGSLPLSVGPDLSGNGGQDAFVAKVSANGASLLFAGLIGGADEDGAAGIAVDSSNYVYVVGYTKSTEATFPVTVGPDLTHNGGDDAFVACVHGNGVGLRYAGYLGGAYGDRAFGAAVVSDWSLCVVGRTQGEGFPALGGPRSTYGGTSDAFFARLPFEGSGLLSSGYVGESHQDEAYGVAVRPGGNDVYMAGGTSGLGSSFPALVGPYLFTNGFLDAWVGRLALPESRPLALAKGTLKESGKPAGDSLKASGGIAPDPLVAFDPTVTPAAIVLGPAADPVRIDIPAGDPGWKWGKGKYAWKSPTVSLKVDFVKGKVTVALKKSDFPSLPANPILVRIELGATGFGAEAGWTESAKSPGSFSYP